MIDTPQEYVWNSDALHSLVAAIKSDEPPALLLMLQSMVKTMNVGRRRRRKEKRGRRCRKRRNRFGRDWYINW